MASIILRSVGAVAGNALLPGVGGAFFGIIGSAAGGFVDQQTGLAGHVTGPQLASLTVQDSRYGAGIPIVYGSARVAGNVIWSTNLMQTQHNSSVSGGKGGGLGGSVTTTTYTYSVHCAVGIALGPIGGIATIWADSTIIYQDGTWSPGVVDAASIYLGTATQSPDAFMQSILGSGNVPAYRGLAYIVFENLQLSTFGNRLPNLTFEIAPAVVTSNPQWLGGVDAAVDQFQSTAQCGGVLPIVLNASASEVSTVLAGGYLPSGSTCSFEVVEYDVTDTTPVELNRVSSANFTASSPSDISWALAPDGRFVAMYLQNISAPTHSFVLYDSEAGQFGAVISPTVAASAATKQIGWIDAQHFVIDDISAGMRGVHVFARAGLNIVDLGFFGVWGAGSSATRLPLYYAQYTPFAGGLINYMTDTASGTSYFSQIFARPLTWQNNSLTVGAPYTVASGLSTGMGSGAHANLIQTGAGEWTLCFGTVIDFHLISFEPGLTSATVTRPWQDFSPTGDPGSTQCPVLFGNRLVIVQRHASDNYYWLSEVALGSSSFSLTIDGVTAGTHVSNVAAATIYYSAIALDNFRLLLAGAGGLSKDLSQFGIIERCPTGDGLDAIMGDVLTRAGYTSGDYDVSALAGANVNGYVLPEPMSARAAIEPLQVYVPFDVIESGTQLKAVLRHASADASIPSGEWRAANDKAEPPPALEVTRAQELDLPVEVDVDYIDPSRNFEVNSQRARRITSRARSVQKINLPVVCSHDTAKQIAETRLYALWAERELVRLRISRRWLTLEPGDVVDLGNGSLLRVTNVNQAGGLMEVEGFYVNASIYASAAAADAGQPITGTALATVASRLYLMDLPLLQSADDQPGVYAAATGLPGWKGASLWRAADGVNYRNIASLPQMATAGIAVSTLGNGSGFYIDSANSVQVQLINGELSSCALLDIYNGANAALLDNEIIQFQSATLTAPGLYTLSNLLRGRRGTESSTGTHAVGENFVLLISGTVDFVPALSTNRNATYEFRALSNGQSLSDAQDNDFTYSLATIRPFAPANITGSRINGTGSDLTLVWKRRARLSAEWVDYVDVPLDEPTELYDVDVMNGSSVLRTFASLTSPTITYTAAQQAADWGTVPASFTVNVYQISSRYGRGLAGTAMV